MRLDHGKFWFHEIQFFEVLQLIWRWVEEFPPNVLEVPLKYKLSMNTWVDAINYVITKHKSFPCKRFTSYLPMWSYKKCNGPFPLTIFAAISRAILQRFQIVRVNYWRLNNCYIADACSGPTGCYLVPWTLSNNDRDQNTLTQQLVHSKVSTHLVLGPVNTIPLIDILQGLRVT